MNSKYHNILADKNECKIDGKLIYYIVEGDVLIIIPPNKIYLYVYQQELFVFISVICNLWSCKIAQR